MTGRAVRTLGTGVALLAMLGAAGLFMARANRRDPPRPAGRPMAVYPITRRDLGAVPAGESASVTFPVRNEGGEPLRILGAEGDCGCVMPQYPAVVPAGGSAEIRARFEPELQWDGPVEKHLRVTTDDPARPEVSLVVAAEVVPLIAMEPATPLVLPYRPGETFHREVRLLPRADRRFDITGARSDSPLVRAVLTAPAPGDRTREHRLKLTIGPCRQAGDFTATVRLSTTDPRLVERWYVVTGQAMSGPVVSPREVSLPIVTALDTGQELSRVQVFARTGRLRLKRVETGTPSLRARVESPNPSQFHEVVLTAAERLKPGPLRTTLRIRTDDPAAPVLTVPVTATVE